MADGTAISNTTTVDSSTLDPNTTNNAATATTTASNPPPTITGAAANPSVLWPPNHRMVNVTVSYEVTDNCALPPNSCTLTCDRATNRSMATEVVIHLQTGLFWMHIMCYFERSGQATAMDASIRLPSPARTAAATPQASRWRYVCLTTEAGDRFQTDLESGGGPSPAQVVRLFPTRNSRESIQRGEGRKNHMNRLIGLRVFRRFLPAIILSLAAQVPAVGQSWPQISFANPIGGFHHPTHVAVARDGSRRLFVTEQAGVIRIVRNGGRAADTVSEHHRPAWNAGKSGIAQRGVSRPITRADNIST